jgi:hypothetical protein
MSVAPQHIEGGRDSRRASEAPDDKGVGLCEKLKLNETGSGDCYAELRRIPLPKLSEKPHERANLLAIRRLMAV